MCWVDLRLKDPLIQNLVTILPEVPEAHQAFRVARDEKRQVGVVVHTVAVVFVGDLHLRVGREERARLLAAPFFRRVIIFLYQHDAGSHELLD